MILISRNLVARGSIVSSAMASTFESPDARKEEFRRYLERSGVIDALTKVLVGLYEEPEKPAQALDFIKMTLGAPTGVDVEAIRAENDNLKKEVAELKSTIEDLNARVRPPFILFRRHTFACSAEIGG